MFPAIIGRKKSSLYQSILFMAPSPVGFIHLPTAKQKPTHRINGIHVITAIFNHRRLRTQTTSSLTFPFHDTLFSDYAFSAFSCASAIACFPDIITWGAIVFSHASIYRFTRFISLKKSRSLILINTFPSSL